MGHPESESDKKIRFRLSVLLRIRLHPKPPTAYDFNPATLVLGLDNTLATCTSALL